MSIYRKTRTHTTPAGFTLVELLIVIAIIGILLAMFAPAAFEAFGTSRTVMCQRRLGDQWRAYRSAVEAAGNAKVKANTVRIYSQRYAPEDSAGEEMWACDANADGLEGISYGYNILLHRMAAGTDNKRIMALDYNQEVVDVVGWEAEDEANGNWEEDHAPRHRERINVLYHRGGTETLDPEVLNPNLSEAQIEFWIPRRERAGLQRDDDGNIIPIKEVPDLPPPPEELGEYGY